jgi:putative FmdB family regulatory protein
MPIYEYMPTSAESCSYCAQGFEQLQRMRDAELASCPMCRAPVRRVLSAPSLARSGPSLDPANVEKHGFTQYRKAGKGVYQKTAGKGPEIISDKE